ncbi:MAG: hypothetical protein U1E39_07090 [Planctomycetota bacterium]
MESVGQSTMQREIGRRKSAFLAISAVFGLSYGCYMYYAFIYLNRVCGLVKASNPTSDLLIVLLATMLFEAFAEPTTGDYADLRGRRRAQILAFSLLALGFVIYATLAPVAVLIGTPITVVAGAIVAEFVIALALAFQSGALEAWISDAIGALDPAHRTPAALTALYGRGSQVFSIGTVLGGSTAIAIGNAAPELSYLPWAIAAALSLFTMLLCAASMNEDDRPGTTASEEPIRAFSTAQRVMDVLQGPETRFALLVSSIAYCAAIVYAFFGPVLLSAIVADRWMWAYPWLMLIARIVGPELSRSATRRWSTRRVGFVAAAVVAASCVVLGLGGTVAPGCWLVAAGFVLTTANSAGRPAQLASIDASVPSTSKRALLLSLSTPLGSLLAGTVAGGVALAFAVTGNDWPIAVMFLIVGGTCSGALAIGRWLTSPRPQRPVDSADVRS